MDFPSPSLFPGKEPEEAPSPPAGLLLFLHWLRSTMSAIGTKRTGELMRERDLVSTKAILRGCS